MTSAEQMQQKLGPSLCLAKWQQVSLHLPTGLTNSCYHPPLHRIPVDDLKINPGSLHNTPWKKQQRKLMLAGEKPDECSYCWNIEKHNQLSDRHYRSGESWASEHFDRIVTSTGDEDEIPSYVEVNFNNACNLACSYCSPQFSSTWMQEIDRHGAYPTAVPHNAPEHFSGERRPIPNREHNPYVDAFWEWWPQLYPKLKHFRMTGGEPLMDRNTYRVFDYVLAAPKPDLHLDVTSNFSVEDKLFDKYIDYVQRLCKTNIEHFMQYVSIDTGFIAHAEYIRRGLNAQRMWSNVHRYLEQVPERNSITFIATMNNLSILGLRSLLELILELRKTYSSTYQRVWFDTPLLRQPAWQSLQILPESYMFLIEEARDFMLENLETEDDPFHGFKDYEVQRIERDLDWARSAQDQDWSKEKADFYRFFSEYDRRHKTNFESVFPEMRQWWEECRYHANR